MEPAVAPIHVPLPRLGRPAPRFQAVTTHGELDLDDFKGSWLVFFSHPADFTPVCTTEFLAFARVHPELRSIGCELLGLSIDSVYAHIAWVRNIEENFGVKIEFPVIADLDRKVASAYGMVMTGESDTETARSVFVIDDRQTLRAMIHYPSTTGRNVDEIVRLVRALQTADEYAVATPANWKPGDKAIVPPPKTQERAEARVRETKQFDVTDWYFAEKTLERGR